MKLFDCINHVAMLRAIKFVTLKYFELCWTLPVLKTQCIALVLSDKAKITSSVSFCFFSLSISVFRVMARAINSRTLFAASSLLKGASGETKSCHDLPLLVIPPIP